MSDYTRTTEQVRDEWADTGWEADGSLGFRRDPVVFDRWLAAHDAEVAAQTLRDAASAPIPRAALNPRTDGLRQWLRDRADQITKEDR